MQFSRKRYGAILLCFAFLGIVALAVARSGPRLHIPRQTVELGLCDQGAKEFRLPITNTGSSNLIVAEIVPCCRTRITQTVTRVAPGETKELVGEVSVGPGDGAAQWEIYSNDPQGRHSIVIKWVGDRPPIALPNSISAEIRRGQAFERHIRVVDVHSGFPVVEGVSGPHGMTCEAVVEIANMDGAGLSPPPLAREYAVKLRINCAFASGWSDENLNLRLGIGERKYDLPIRLKLLVHSGVLLSPAIVYFGAGEPRGLIGKSARVIAVTEHAGRPVRIKSTPPFVRCSARELDHQSTEIILQISEPPDDMCDNVDVELSNDAGDSGTLKCRLLVYQ